MKKVVKAIAGVFLTFFIGQSAFPTASHAAPFQVGEQNYDIVAVTATFDGLKPLLEKQVWWDNEKLAREFALVVKGSFGFPNMDIQGPYFAYAERDEFTFLTSTFQDITSGNSPLEPGELLSGWFIQKDKPYLFPVATPIAAIPLPASGVMLLMGLAGVVSLRRRHLHAS